MLKKLPESVDFLKQVERGASYEGVWPLARFERLAEVICNNRGEVRARLNFTIRAGTPSLDGRVQAELELSCQRCLEPVKQSVKSNFRFGLITSETEADMLPKEFEPLLVSDGEESLLQLVEDELLLSLPIVAKHEAECSDILLKHKNNDSPQQDTHRPFAGLKDLMR
jgi:uncharacterized protein